jgi:hypothetical protein
VQRVFHRCVALEVQVMTLSRRPRQCGPLGS